MTLILDQILKERNITAIALSEMMDQRGHRLSRLSIGNILNGKHSPKLDTLSEIADTLDLKITELFDTYSGNGMESLYKKDENGEFVKIGFLKKSI